MTQGKLFYWVANWNLSSAQARLLLKEPTALMADCTTGSVGKVLGAYPSIRRFAGYLTGDGIAWTAAQIAAAEHLADARFLPIDQSDQDLDLNGDVILVKDDESGASSTATAVREGKQRIESGRNYTIYCDQSTLGSVEDAVARAGLPRGQIVAYQWASPSSNPNTPLPGTNLTLREANADLSEVLVSWLPTPVEGKTNGTPASSPKGTFTAKLEAHPDGTFELHGTPHIGVVHGGPDEWHTFAGAVNKRTGTWRIHKTGVSKS